MEFPIVPSALVDYTLHFKVKDATSYGLFNAPPVLGKVRVLVNESLVEIHVSAGAESGQLRPTQTVRSLARFIAGYCAAIVAPTFVSNTRSMKANECPACARHLVIMCYLTAICLPSPIVPILSILLTKISLFASVHSCSPIYDS
jgi:hypothetical protein